MPAIDHVGDAVVFVNDPPAFGAGVGGRQMLAAPLGQGLTRPVAPWRIALTRNHRTREFREPEKTSVYGTITAGQCFRARRKITIRAKFDPACYAETCNVKLYGHHKTRERPYFSPPSTMPGRAL